MSTIIEPGVYFRDFEVLADKKHLLYPAYPASKNLCAFGGMLANNSGGEKSLNFGKTEKYVESLNIVLSDGLEHTFEKLDKPALDKKMKEEGFEGEIFRKMYYLVDRNFDFIKNSKPNVSKISSGYNIWNIWDKQLFDLSQVFIGSQGTLGMITKAKLRLIKERDKRGLVIIFLENFDHLPNLINEILEFNPESFESFDNYTFKLALKFIFQFSKILGKKAIDMPLEFLPEFLLVLKERKLPKLVLLVEFNEDDLSIVKEKTEKLITHLKKYNNLYYRVAKNESDIEKYFAIRRESFNLLRGKIKNLKAAPFIDDIIVRPQYLPEFLPKLYSILDEEKLIYTVAGHMGDGNFHIIPLMDLSKKEEKDRIFKIADKVYSLVLEYKGIFSAEHNDGLIRSPYLQVEYGDKIYEIFKEIKNIFDPLNIFNPYKKIGTTKEFSSKYII
jgi:FAD/FMN-containing dehydrogenase